MNSKPKIYLAGPEVFFPDPEKESCRLKLVCESFGLLGCFPTDNQASVWDLDKEKMAENICRADEDLVRSCDAIIANMNPFRGASMDPGTIYEIGFGRGLGKLVVGWISTPLSYWEKTNALYPLAWDGYAWRDKDGIRCPHDGLCDNLMIAKGVDSIHKSFEDAAQRVANYFSKNL